MAPWTPESMGFNEARAVDGLGLRVEVAADVGVERVVEVAVDGDVERVVCTCGGLSTGNPVDSLASSEECALNEFLKFLH